MPWHVPFHRADAISALRASEQSREASGSSSADGAVNREKSAVVFKRYYHLFDEGELEEVVAAVPGLIVEAVFYDKSNWCCSFRKAI